MSPTKQKKRDKKGPATSTLPKKISRDDIESKLQELQGEVDDNVDAAKSIAVPAAVGVAVLLVLLAFLFGRRRGRKRQLVLEIKRI